MYKVLMEIKSKKRTSITIQIYDKRKEAREHLKRLIENDKKLNLNSYYRMEKISKERLLLWITSEEL